MRPSPACACARLSACAHRADVAKGVMSMTDHSHITVNDRDDPVLLAWPAQGNAGGFIQFEKAAEWRAFVGSLGIDTRIPEIVRAKYARAQTLYLLGWVDF